MVCAVVLFVVVLVSFLTCGLVHFNLSPERDKMAELRSNNCE